MPEQVAEEAARQQGEDAGDDAAADEQALHRAPVAATLPWRICQIAPRQADEHEHGEEMNRREAGDVRQVRCRA